MRNRGAQPPTGLDWFQLVLAGLVIFFMYKSYA